MMLHIIIFAILLVFAFSLSFATLWLRFHDNASRLSEITCQLDVTTPECDLASAVMDTRRGDYEQARQSASSLITYLRVETDKEGGWPRVKRYLDETEGRAIQSI